MYVVDVGLEVCNSRYQATLESDILLKSVNSPGYATTPSLEHPYLSRAMFRFSTLPHLRLLGKVCMTKGEDVHGPESDRCSRANQILLGSYWGRSTRVCTPSVVARPGTLPTAIRPVHFGPCSLDLGFLQSPRRLLPRRLDCLLLDSASMYQMLRALEHCRDMIILI